MSLVITMDVTIITYIIHSIVDWFLLHDHGHALIHFENSENIVFCE
jgi:hypothetical protein